MLPHLLCSRDGVSEQRYPLLLCSTLLGRLHARFLLCWSECSPPKSGSKDWFRRYESRRGVASGRVENGSCLLLGTEIMWGPLEAEFSRKNISRVRIGRTSVPELKQAQDMVTFMLWLVGFVLRDWLVFPAQGLDDFKLSSRSGVECEGFFFTLILGPMCLSLVLLSDLCWVT